MGLLQEPIEACGEGRIGALGMNNLTGSAGSSRRDLLKDFLFYLDPLPAFRADSCGIP